MADLEEAIQVARLAIVGNPDDHPDQAAWLNNLGVYLGFRYLRTGAMADLEEAIQVIRQTIDIIPEDHPDQVEQLHNLGTMLRFRYSSTGTIADLEEAIRVYQQVIDTTPEGHLDRSARLNNLGVGFYDRYLRTGVIADLEEAIRVGQQAIDATPEDHPNWVGFLNNLGLRLHDRYLRTRAMPDLEEAIRVNQQVIDMIPDSRLNWATRAAQLSNLGAGLYNRYQRSGVMDDLEEAIRVGRQAVDVTPEAHPDQAAWLSNLGVWLGCRYSRTGIMADLEEAIQVSQQAVNTIPEDHPHQAGFLNTLGGRLSDRYLTTGATADLEEAIRISQKALDKTPDGHPDQAAWLNNFGVILHRRYSRTGAIADLEEAIQVNRQAIDITPEDHLDRAAHFNNLGAKLYDRYLRTRAMADLEEAIQVTQQAIDATPAGYLDRAKRLNNIGIGFHERYLKTGVLADLEEAIRVNQEAIDTTPQDYLNISAQLNNLGAKLHDRYLKIGAITDLEKAIRVGQQAVNTAPEDHIDRAAWFSNLGFMFCDRYSKTGTMADLEEAIVNYQSALHQANSPTITRIMAGRNLLDLCAVRLDWQRAYEVSAIAIHLIPNLAARSLGNSDKQQMLGQVAGFASGAAAAALNAEKGPLLAVELLEQGRGVLATSLEELRTDILELQERQPELAGRYVQLRDKLELPVTLATSFIAGGHESLWRTQVSRRYDANKELEQVISQIRKQPGSEGFLLPPSEREIRAAARNGPIIVVNVSQYRCDAILVEQHQIRSLALPRLKNEEIKEKAQRDGLGSPSILEWLWEAVASPILDALGFTQPPINDDWPHIWWIPTGPLSKFPLHAAGYHNKRSSETVLDRAMSSYSPSINAIIHGRRRLVPKVKPPATARALLVAMEHTTGYSMLSFAKKEVAMLRGLLKLMSLGAIEPGRRKQDITSNLAYCKIFHFAGHGHTDDKDPSMSQLLLEDGQSDPLTVAHLLEMNLRRKPPFLAYLSACGTGQLNNEKFVDESIHLISACNLAGFRHVIGTLWEVDDELCVDMARITYEGMSDGAMTDESVCRGLHNATRELRDRWLSARAKARSGRSFRDAGERETGSGSASNEDQRGNRLFEWCDEEEEEEEAAAASSLHWVPYVHFGV